MEREEDRTGPYAYDAKHWIAFDDASSLKIKVRFTWSNNDLELLLNSISLPFLCLFRRNTLC